MLVSDSELGLAVKQDHFNCKTSFLVFTRRHPLASGRPEFNCINKWMSIPSMQLLKWMEEDKSVHPAADQLGADLLCGEGLYKDLQNKYLKP